ncbi:MAG: nicotinamide-nucleotide amidohydrolase family protein [Chryseobacterium sp.]|nr:MAG: nicotinamide-nucleotide amidohydrolase family protein [Chryseobacterium sp.]
MDEASAKTAQEITRLLKDKKESVACAESVTAGMVQSMLAGAEGAASVFQGGVTVYNLGQKAKLLDVEPINAEMTNCVSQKVADEMALGVVKMFRPAYGLSITGYAEPLPEKDIADVFAFIAVANNDKILLQKKIDSSKEKSPDQVREQFRQELLQQFLKILQE